MQRPLGTRRLDWSAILLRELYGPQREICPGDFGSDICPQIGTSMQDQPGKMPLITQGWVRAILFLIIFLGGILVTGVLIGTIIHTSNIPILAGNSNSDLTIIGLLSISALSVILVVLFRIFIDRKSLSSLGFKLKDHKEDATVGLLLGIVLACVCALILYATKNIEWNDVTLSRDLSMIAGLMIVSALAEEIVFRGYILNNLLESMNKWGALIISAVLFAAVHINNPNIIITAMLNLFAGGMLLGINYIYTKNLWFSILLHFSWNFFQGPLLGFPVSGIEFKSVLQMESKGNLILTGGEFGMEGSILTGIVLMIAWLLLYFAYERKQSATFTHTRE